MSYRISSVQDGEFTIAPDLWARNKQERALLMRYFALPLKETQSHLYLGVESLDNLNACEVFAFLRHKIVEPVILAKAELSEALKALNDMPRNEQDYSQQLYQRAPLQAREEREDDEPVIALLQEIFDQALKQKASDLHFEPNEHGLKVRFRVDGVLRFVQRISPTLAPRVLSRLKLLASLDISETRLPQDGAFHFTTRYNDKLDFRLSVMPTHLGEKAVLRLQHNEPIALDFTALGMNDEQVRMLSHALSQPQGLILVTGPTGSGKSITLYSALASLNSPEKHILTAEDPIEITLDGIVQTQINPAIGLTFDQLLRTFLRQDPDIIMLGEIRDEASAKMALRAAQTGHLVLSTLHTNDARSAIERLGQLGIARHEITSSLLLVIAQRLLRRRCSCHSSGCQDCHEGYQGRVGIYQFLTRDDKENYQLDYTTLYASGEAKVRSGITDHRELVRVLGRAR
ncbi:GspE/PulE family protein [Spirabiliibacterium pneumoniae]|uniref:GspE/PulE family protein n=1 Tax=Spirabiliibacterium pneumoniae TaxID=221400 RepID=UPI002E295508|nr:GspE/PulE family protein [Spirabiliibacterium pneumoniae]